MAKTEKPTVEERLDVQELFAKYCWALNTGDEQGYLDLFAEGGWVDHKPQGKCQGPEAMRKLLNQIWYGTAYNYLGRQHLPNNFILTREGDAIRVKAYWTITRLEQAFNKFELFIQGHWDALCVRDGDDWKFAELTATHWFRETAPWVGKADEVRLERKLPWG